MDIKLNKILIKTKRQVFSDIAGNNISPLKGDGYDFAELREYEVGDNVKNIDWTISAKLHKPYVKIFHTQRKLNIAAVSLLSGSTYFGSEDIFKNELIAQIVAILGYSALKQNDNFLSIISSDSTYLINKKFNTTNSIRDSVKKILQHELIGKNIDYNQLFISLSKLLKKRTILFLVGDFIGIDKYFKSLRLMSKKYELIAIIVRDKFEENPKALGKVYLKDLTTNKNLYTNINEQSIEQYRQNLKQKDSLLYKEFHKNRIRYTKVYTNEDPFVKLKKMFL